MSNHQPQKRFGTDGIRGLANVGPLNIDEVVRLGEATAVILKKKLKKKTSVGLGWDTRVSSPALAHALAAGLSSGGVNVIKFGVIPTPAVARLTTGYKLDGGIVISASHNPAEDNGIKYFDSQGGKFPDQIEKTLEKQLDQAEPIKHETGCAMGAIEEIYGDAALAYRQQVVKQFKQCNLAGLKIVADLANGATCRTVTPILDDLGIKARYIGDQPNGLNINQDCGSLYPEKVAELVRKYKADAGLAFDGDGDRVMVIAEDGSVLNGDRLIGILAAHYKKKRLLKEQTVVTTVMSNLGLERFLETKGIKMLRAQVGDRYVAELMKKHGSILGGEQSGHMLLPRLTSTGDGLVTALEVLAVMQSTGQPLSVLASGWENYPQLLINIPVAKRPLLKQLAQVQRVCKEAGKALAQNGRFNCRYSGTEPLARVMVEAVGKEEVVYWANKIAAAIEKEIGVGRKWRETWLTCV